MAETSVGRALLAGMAGAVTLNLLHETVRRLRPADAPRMDVLGMRALSKLFRAVDSNPPPAPELHQLALASDLVANGLYYSMAGTGPAALWRGAALGVAAGVGGVLLPGPLGLGEAQSNRTPQTQAMTVAWYTIGGLVAGAVGYALGNPDEEESPADDLEDDDFADAEDQDSEDEEADGDDDRDYDEDHHSRIVFDD